MVPEWRARDGRYRGPKLGDSFPAKQVTECERNIQKSAWKCPGRDPKCRFYELKHLRSADEYESAVTITIALVAVLLSDRAWLERTKNTIWMTSGLWSRWRWQCEVAVDCRVEKLKAPLLLAFAGEPGDFGALADERGDAKCSSTVGVVTSARGSWRPQRGPGWSGNRCAGT